MIEYVLVAIVLAMIIALILFGTTQTASVTLCGSGDNDGYTATCTDDAFTELKSAIGTLSLYQGSAGKVFHSYMGRYAAGGGMLRIRNTSTGKIKALEPLALNGATQTLFSNGSIKVEMNDVIEVFTEAAPT